MFRRETVAAAAAVLAAGCTGGPGVDGDAGEEPATGTGDAPATDTPRPDGEGPSTAGDADDPPTVDWTFEYDPGRETLRVEHAGGEAVAASALFVAVGDPAATGYGDAADTQFDDRYERVEAGDAVTVDVGDAAAGDRVSVVWKSPRGITALDGFDLPGSDDA